MLAPERQRARRLHPSATIFMPATTSAIGRPCANSIDVPIATQRTRARREIPRPLNRKRLAPAAARARRVISAAACNQGGERVLPQPEALDDARRDRDDVLQRAADLDADDVGARIQPEVRGAKLTLDVLGQNRIDAGNPAAVGPGRAPLRSRSWARQHHDRPRAHLLRDHFRHAQ
jgi:hypothetical protein